MRCDIAIIGAGPTGCYSAWELARLGYDVLLVEEHEQVGEPQHCTGVIGLEAFEKFDLPRDCIRASMSKARFYSPAGEWIEIVSGQPQAVIVDRAEFDRALAQRAVAAGAGLALGKKATALRCNEEGAAVCLEGESGGELVKARLCLAATGAANGLLQQAGLAQRQRWVLGARVEVDSNHLECIEIHFGRQNAPAGFAWVVPTGNGKARVGMLGPRCSAAQLRRFIGSDALADKVSMNGDKIQCRPIPLGPCRPSFGTSIMAIGDAAGQVKTTTGGGVYYGLLGAQAAVETADEAFRKGDFSARFLSRYERRWMKRIGGEQRVGMAFRKIGSALPDRQIDALFRLLKVTGMSRALSAGAQFDWHAGRTLVATIAGLAAQATGLHLLLKGKACPACPERSREENGQG